MVDTFSVESRLHIREFDEGRDVKVVGKLERKCEIGTKKGVSIFTNMMGDPLSRIRLYPLHVMLVAELLESKELVGVVRGCIKSMRTPSESLLKIGCILGLRVSPSHRRKGIGLKLVTSVEEWMLRNGAEYAFLATEKNNDASRNLFTNKCKYVSLSSLFIFVHPISFPAKQISKDIEIEKVNIDQAISLYRRTLMAKELYPLDMDSILKENLSLGTWVSYYKEGGLLNLQRKEESEDIITNEITSSWIIFSIWNTCEAYKLQLKKSQPLRPFGFLFLYGLHGEGENLGELMESIWRFTSRMGESLKDCTVVITELGFGDPLVNHIPQTASMSCIDDIWYTKRISSHSDEKDDELLIKRQIGNVFVDPRDF
ncbi:hypothetical protein LR48_Vigan01g298800 [Vigna angularis]|uniref:N-acetyltransferase domain-containing protein n=1 Tax=Phaseolus angularis TaxID=3914 RepID=A0A0L9TSN2_PHAAN|nr:hypothetical protein LR48_Vigan01g298800 [Vigna angularis]